MGLRVFCIYQRALSTIVSLKSKPYFAAKKLHLGSLVAQLIAKLAFKLSP